MALSPTDPAYRAEVVPNSVDVLGKRLCVAYQRPAAAFGAKGNLTHYSGYHRSRRWILNSPDSRYGERDYSVLRDLDRGGDEDWVSAFDFTPGEWGSRRNRELMVELTGRVYAAAKARDPRVSVLREFSGTLDGKTVVTFNCADGSLKSPFDSSHLDHGHGSFWRARAADDHSGLLAVLIGGDDMSQQAESILAALASGGLSYVDNAGKTQQFVPTVEIYRQLDFRKAVTNILTSIAERVDIDAAELDAVKAAAKEGALSAADGLAAAVVAALPEGERVTKSDVEHAIRSVLGGLDGATPA
jgi:hypothetical protein